MNIFLIFVCAYFLLFGSCRADSNVTEPQHYVKLYNLQHFQGDMEQLNLTSSCNSVAHFTRTFGRIRSMNTKDNCLNVYTDEDCSGQFISLKPGNPYHDELERWNNIHLRIKAIGRCHHDCHETKIERYHQTANVEVFRNKSFEGTTQRLTLQKRMCSPLSEEMQGVIMSFKVNPKVCIELHEFANCSGHVRDFPVGSPSHDNLKHWDWYEKLHVGSISFCGYRCLHGHNHTDNYSNTTIDTTVLTPLETEAPIENSSEHNYEAIYDYKDYDIEIDSHEEPAHVNVTVDTNPQPTHPTIQTPKIITEENRRFHSSTSLPKSILNEIVDQTDSDKISTTQQTVESAHSTSTYRNEVTVANKEKEQEQFDLKKSGLLTEAPTHYTVTKVEERIESEPTSGNYIWIIFIVSLTILVLLLTIVGAREFFKRRYGNSGYTIMFHNKN